MRTYYTIIIVLLHLIPTCKASTGSLNFSVSPSIVSIKVTPNSRKTVNLSILNSSDQDLTLSVSVQDFTTNQNGNTVVVPANASSFSAATWITPEKKLLSVTAGTRTTFTAYLKMPHGVAGGRYAVILFEPIASKKTGGVQLSGRIGVLVMLSIAGQHQLSAQLLDFQSHAQKNVVYFRGDIKNTGNIHYKCHADIVIFSANQRIVDRLNISWPSKTILPNTTRTIDVSWDNPRKMKPGKYDVKLRFFIHGGKKTLQKTIPIQIK